MRKNLLVKDAAEFVGFLIEHDLTADQFLFCILLSSEKEEYMGSPDKDSAIPKLYEYRAKVSRGNEDMPWVQSDIEELLERDFIQRISSEEHDWAWDNFEVTDKFLDLVFEKKEDIMDKFEEFWNTYPARYESEDGDSFPVKAVNPEDLFDLYKSHLQETDHETLLKCLKIAKAKDELNIRIDNWLDSHQWEAYIDEIDDTVPEDNSIQQTVI